MAATSSPPPSIVALIPARSGSVRVADKNIRRLNGHPMIAYTIAAARASGIFARVIVSTDSEAYAEIARHYGAMVLSLRPAAMASATSPDIDWVEYTLDELGEGGCHPDCFSILRPTSPFRTAQTIQRAWKLFLAEDGIDSLRAVEPVEQHPGKMWVVRGRRMTPLLPLTPEAQPWHSTQKAALPAVFVQNASLEIAWTRVVREGRTIAGAVLMPFFTEGHEGFDINNERDWRDAEAMLAAGEAMLTKVEFEPFRGPNP